MTNEERKVIELALAVLEKIATVNAMDYEYQRWAKEHLVTIKEALAQPEQKPVAWLEPEWGERICPEIGFEATITSDHPRDLCWIPLYPHQPQRTWVGLTDEEFTRIQKETPYTQFMTVSEYALQCQIKHEAKLKEKNT